jgi:hypothetical protein
MTSFVLVNRLKFKELYMSFKLIRIIANKFCFFRLQIVPVLVPILYALQRFHRIHKMTIMENNFRAQAGTFTFEKELHVSFNKNFVSKSKSLLVVMGVASLYCLAYGIVLFHEFKKMGIFDHLISGR